MFRSSPRIDQLTALVQADSSNESYHLLLGKEYMREGRYMEAVAKFRSVTELDPELSEAWRLLASAYEKAQLSKEARAASETAEIVDSHDR